MYYDVYIVIEKLECICCNVGNKKVEFEIRCVYMGCVFG